MKPVARITIPCAACGADVTMRETDYAQRPTGRVFCNAKCRGRVGGKPRRGADKACEQCGESFYAHRTSASRNEPRFCSKACHDEHQRAKSVNVTCAICEKVFRMSKSEFERRRGPQGAPLVCGRECDRIRRTTNGIGRQHNGRDVIRWNTGYLFVYEPDHPYAVKNGWVAEHRWVKEQELGRVLTPKEHVHHINGKKWDNRPENLDVLGHSEHSSLSAKERKAALAAMEAELVEYRSRFGPLT